MRHEIHPWFAHPRVNQIRQRCIDHGFDFLERDGENTRAMNDAHIEDRGEGKLPWLFGPTIHPLPDTDLAELTAWMDDWLLDINAMVLTREPIRHFSAQIGRQSLHIKYSLEGASFLAASESRENSTAEWLTVNWFSFDRHISSSATEEAIYGGRQAFLADRLANHPISQTLQYYEIAEERPFSADCVQICKPILKESK